MLDNLQPLQGKLDDFVWALNNLSSEVDVDGLVDTLHGEGGGWCLAQDCCSYLKLCQLCNTGIDYALMLLCHWVQGQHCWDPWGTSSAAANQPCSWRMNLASIPIKMLMTLMLLMMLASKLMTLMLLMMLASKLMTVTL